MWMRIRARILLAAIAVAAGSVLVATPGAQAGGANNVVIANATADGQMTTRSQLQVASFAGGAADSSNLALATSAGCTGCSTTAVAVQAVFLTGDSSSVTPANVAAATNSGCDSCTAYAYAWQYVLSTDGPVYLSSTGVQEVATLRREIAAAASSGLPPAELTSTLDALAAKFKSVIDDELLRAGSPVSGHVVQHVDVAPSQ
jgi:putative peptide zinc metalloprotease protein